MATSAGPPQAAAGSSRRVRRWTPARPWHALAITVTLGLVPALLGAQAPEPPAPAESAEKITFSLPFPAEQGGGEVTGTATLVEYRDVSFVELSGEVEILYQDLALRADQVSVDLDQRSVEAMGHVIIDQGPSRLVGTRATFDLVSRQGVVEQASATLEGDYYFSGQQIAKVGDDLYEVENGTFTACEGEVPAWSFQVSRASVELDAYARIHHARMRIKRAPVLYFPYLVWPTKTDRSSGILVPKVGRSNDRGTYLGLAYYQTLGRSADATLYADLWSNEYYGFGTEIRYHPTPGTKGTLEAYGIDDPVADDTRWKINWDHVTEDLPFGMRGVIHYEDYSDFTFFRDFERRLDYKARSSVYASGFASGNWGNHSFNLLLDQRQNFAGVRPVELRQLPELQYKLRSQRLGSLPVYLSVESSAHFFSVDRTDLYQGDYQRFDLFPTLKVPVSSWPWLSMSVTVGQRFTQWSDSLTQASGANAFSGESLSRSVPQAGVEVVGPSFSRVFEVDGARVARLKHIIEPRFDWSYADAFDEQNQVPVFDEIDPFNERNVGRVALIQRLLAKPTVEAAGPGANPGEVESPTEGQEPAAELDLGPPQNPEEGVLSVTGDVMPPEKIQASPPRYTTEARQARVQGVVIVQVIIDEEGRVRSPRVIKSLPMGLDQAASDAVQAWQFQPATLDGQPVAVYYNLSLSFRISGGGQDAGSKAGAAREVLSFEVSRRYSFDSARPLESGLGETSEWSPWRATFRAYPSQRLGLRVDADYSGLFGRLTSLRATGSVAFGTSRIDFSWSPTYQATTGETLSNQASVGVRFEPLPGRMTISSRVNYDIERDLLRDQRHFLTYRGSCYTLTLELHESRIGTERRRDYLFSVDLKNVGTFLDLTGGQSRGS